MKKNLFSALFMAFIIVSTLPGCIWIVDPGDNEDPVIESAVAELVFDGSQWTYLIDVVASDGDLDSLTLDVTVSQPEGSTVAVTWSFDPANSWSESLALSPDFLPQWDAEFTFVVNDGHGGSASRSETLETTVESPWVDTFAWACDIDADNVAFFWTEVGFLTPQSPIAQVTARFMDDLGGEKSFNLSADPGAELLWFFEADAVDTSINCSGGVYDVEIMAADDRGVTSYTVFEDVAEL